METRAKERCGASFCIKNHGPCFAYLANSLPHNELSKGKNDLSGILDFSLKLFSSLFVSFFASASSYRKWGLFNFYTE